MKVEAVIFDIGNVLITWDPEGYYDRAIGPARRQTFFNSFDFYDLMNRMDAGAHFANTIEDAACANPDWSAEIRLLRDDWTGVAQPAIPGSVRLLEALKKKGVPVFTLTNFGAQNFPLSAAQFPFLNLFDRFYVSGKMGLIKPDPAIYAAVEKDCTLDPQTLLFTDDRAENIDAAAARGWQTHPFKNSEGWQNCLLQIGVLTAKDLI